MDRCQRLFVLLLGYLCCGYCAVLKTSFVGFAKDAEFGQKVETHGRQHAKKTEQDTLSEHMQMLYAKYNSAEFPLKDGNTVRSFKAHLGMLNVVKLFFFQVTLRLVVSVQSASTTVGADTPVEKSKSKGIGEHLVLQFCGIFDGVLASCLFKQVKFRSCRSS